MKVNDLHKPTASCSRISSQITRGGGVMNKKNMFLAIATVILVVTSILPLAFEPVKAQSQNPQIVDEAAYIASRCPNMKTDIVETSYSTGIAIHHTVVYGGGNWFEAAIGESHCRESRPPYLLVIDKDGVIHQTAVFGSKTNHAKEPNNTEYASIALVGNFEIEKPTDAQKTSLVYAISWLEEQGVPAVVKGHREIAVGYATACPGKNLFAILPEVSAEAQGETLVPFSLPSLPEWVKVWSPTGPELKGWNQLDNTLKALLSILFGSMAMLILVLWIRGWVLKRRLRRFEKQKEGERWVVRLIRFLYWWLTIILLILSLWKKNPGLWLLTTKTFQIWLIYFIENLLARYLKRIKVENLPLPVELGALVFRVIVKGAFIAYLLSFCWTYFQLVQSVKAEEQRWLPQWQKEEAVPVSPVKYSGPPIAELPEGVVIPTVWDPIWQGVQDEGGTEREAMLLYATQRSECARTDMSTCTSYAGAQGPFQFMPGTWPDYSEPGWSVWNLHDSSRAAYRMFKKLQLFEQTDRQSFQNRFTGQDGWLVWNKGVPGAEGYDGWDQSGQVWDSYEEILRTSNEEQITAPEPALSGDVSISVSRDVPPDQQRNVLLWAERNGDVVVAAGGYWDFCEATDNTGWYGYDYAADINAGGICANASMVYNWVQVVPGLEVEVEYPHKFYPSYPVFTKVVDCPSATFKIRNTTDKEIIGRWIVEGDTLILRQVR